MTKDHVHGEAEEKLGPYRFFENKKGHRATTDSLLLARFTLPIKEGSRVLDFGTGAGVLPLVFAWKIEACRITAIEADKEAAALAAKNVLANKLSEKVEVINADWRKLDGVLETGSFDVVVSNPPYVKKGTGRVSPYAHRATARHETLGTLTDLVRSAARLTAPKGRIVFIYPVKRFRELVSEFKAAGFSPSRFSFVMTKKNSLPELFLIEFKRRARLRVGPCVNAWEDVFGGLTSY